MISIRPLLLVLTLGLTSQASAALYITIVQGLGGLPEYEEKFTRQKARIVEASQTLTDGELVTVFDGESATRENLLAHFDSLAETMTGQDRVIVYLIGHGSYDGFDYKFNIPGMDVTAADLQDMFDALPGSNHFLVNTSSTSGAILDSLESEDRIVVTATRNGNERNATEFGAFFSEALSSDEADINKNNRISVQEAFDFAERRVNEFFESSGKLATEHPQIRGDGAAQLNLARINVEPIDTPNPELNSLYEQRQSIDAEIESLQLNREDYSDQEYNRRLRDLILQSATVGEQIDALEGSDNSASEAE